MKRHVENWSIAKLEEERPSISFPEYQRQSHLWPTEKKSLLIDSILRDIDIPKLYFSLTEKDEYEVVDGQQRLWAIWDFLDGKFSCIVDGSALSFSQLDSKLQARIREYVLQVVVIEDADDEYLRELFLRLQLGLLLMAGEKLHARTGEMKDFVFDTLPPRPFIANLGIPERRYAKETLCAQICINSFMRSRYGIFARTRYEDLLYFFQQYAAPQGDERDIYDDNQQRIVAIVDKLGVSFGDAARELRNRSYILSIYLLFEELVGSKALTKQEDQKAFAQFTVKLWARVREEAKAGFNRTNPEVYAFDALVSSAPGERYQIEARNEKLFEFWEHFRKTGKIRGD